MTDSAPGPNHVETPLAANPDEDKVVRKPRHDMGYTCGA